MIARSSMKLVLRKASDGPEISLPEQIDTHVSRNAENKIPPYANPTYINTSTGWPNDAVALPRTKRNQTYRDFRIERQLREDHASITGDVMRQHGLQVPHRGIADLLRIGHNTAETGMPYLSPPATAETAHTPRPLTPAEESDYQPDSLYHGTTSNFRDIDPKMMFRAQSEAGFYLGDQWTAKRYSSRKKGTDLPTVKEYRLPRSMKIFDHDDDETALDTHQKDALQDLITKIAKYHGIDTDQKIEDMYGSAQRNLFGTPHFYESSEGDDPLTIGNMIAHADGVYRAYHDAKGDLQINTTNDNSGVPLYGGLTASHAHSMANKFVELIRDHLHHDPSNKYYVGPQASRTGGDTTHLFPTAADYGFPHGHDMQSHFLSVLGYDGTIPDRGGEWRVIFPHATHKLRCVGEEIQKSFNSQLSNLHKSGMQESVSSITHPYEFIDHMSNAFIQGRLPHFDSTHKNPDFYMSSESQQLYKNTCKSAWSAMRQSHAAIARKYFPSTLQGELTGSAGRDIGRLGHISHPDVPTGASYKGPAVPSPLSSQEQDQYHAPRLFHGSRSSASETAMIDPKYFSTAYIGTGLYTTTDTDTAKRYAQDGVVAPTSLNYGHVREYAIPKTMKILDDSTRHEPMNSEQHDKIVKFLQEVARFHGVDPDKLHETSSFEGDRFGDPVLLNLVAMWKKTGPYNARNYDLRALRTGYLPSGRRNDAIPPQLSFSDVLKTADWRHGELESLAQYAKDFINTSAKQRKIKEYIDKVTKDSNPQISTAGLEYGRSAVGVAMDRASDSMVHDLRAHMGGILGYDGTWNAIDDFGPGVYRGDDPDAPEAKLPWHVPPTSEVNYAFLHQLQSYNAGVRGHMVLFPHAANKARLVGVHSADMAEYGNELPPIMGKSLRKAGATEPLPPVKSPYDMLAKFGERVSKPTSEIDTWKNPYADGEKKDRINAYLSSLQMLPGMRSAHAAIARRYFPESLQQDLAFTPGRDFARLGHVSDPIAPAGQSPYRAAAVASPLSLAEQGDYHQQSLFHGSKAPLGTAGQIDPKHFRLATLGTGLYMTTRSGTAHRYAGATGHVREYVIPKTLNILDDREIGNRVSTDQKTRIINFLRDTAKMHGFDPDKMLAMRPHDLLTPTEKTVRRLCERFGSWTKKDRVRETLGGGINPISRRDSELLLPDEHSMTSILRGIDIRPHDLATLAYYVKDILEASLFYDPDNTHKKTIDRLSNASGKSSAAVLGSNPFILSRSKIWSDMYAHMAAILGYDGIWNHTQDGGLGAYRGANFDSPESKIPWHTAPSTAGDSPVSGIMLLMPHAANKARLVQLHPSEPIAKSLRKAGDVEAPQEHPLAAQIGDMYRNDSNVNKYHHKINRKIRNIHALIAKDFFPPDVRRQLNARQVQDIARIGHESDPKAPTIAPYTGTALPKPLSPEEIDIYHPQTTGSPTETPSNGLSLYHGTPLQSTEMAEFDPKHATGGLAGTGFYLSNTYQMARLYTRRRGQRTPEDKYGHIREYVAPKSLKMLTAPEMWTPAHGAARERVIKYAQTILRAHGFDLNHQYDLNTSSNTYGMDAESQKKEAFRQHILQSLNNDARYGAASKYLPKELDRKNPKISIAELLQAYGNHDQNIDHYINSLGTMLASLATFSPNNHHSSYAEREDAERLMQQDFQAHIGSILGYDGIWHGEFRDVIPWHLDPMKDAYGFVFPHAASQMRLVGIHEVPEKPVEKSFSKSLPDMPATPAYVGLHEKEFAPHVDNGDYQHLVTRLTDATNAIRQEHAALASQVIDPKKSGPVGLRNLAGLGSSSLGRLLPSESAASSVSKPAPTQDGGPFAPTRFFHGTTAPSSWLDEIHPGLTRVAVLGQGFYLSPHKGHAATYANKNRVNGHIREYRMPSDLTILHTGRKIHDTVPDPEKMRSFVQSLFEHHGIDIDKKHEIHSWKTESLIEGIKLAINGHKNRKSMLKEILARKDITYRDFINLLGTNAHLSGKDKSSDSYGSTYGNPLLLSGQMMSMIRENLLHDRSNRHALNALQQGPEAFGRFSQNVEDVLRPSSVMMAVPDLSSHMAAAAGYDGYFTGGRHELYGTLGVASPPFMAHGGALTIYPHAVHRLMHVRNHQVGKRPEQPSQAPTAFERAKEMFGRVFARKSLTESLIKSLPEIPYFEESDPFDHQVRKIMHAHAEIARRHLPAVTTEGSRDLLRIGHVSDPSTPTATPYTGPAIPMPLTPDETGSYLDLPVFHGTTAPSTQMAIHDPKRSGWSTGMFATTRKDIADTYGRARRTPDYHIREYRIPKSLQYVRVPDFDDQSNKQVIDPFARKRLVDFLTSLAKFHGVDPDKSLSFRTQSMGIRQGLPSIRSMAENLTSPLDFVFSTLLLKKIKTNILDDPSNDHAQQTNKNRIANLLDNPMDDQLAEHIAAVLGYDGYHRPYSNNDSTGKNIESQKGVYVTFPHALHKLRLVGIHQKEEPSFEKSLGDPTPTGANEAIAQHLARPRTAPSYMDHAYTEHIGYGNILGDYHGSERLVQQLREDHAAIAAPFLQKRTNMPSLGVSHLLRIGHGTESTGIPFVSNDSANSTGARNLPRDQYHEFPVYHGTAVDPAHFADPLLVSKDKPANQIDPSLFRRSSYSTGFYVTPEKFLADVYARNYPHGFRSAFRHAPFNTGSHVREYLVPKKLNLFFHDDHRTFNRILPISENADTSFDHEHLKNAADFLLEVAKFHGIDPDKPFADMGEGRYIALRELLQRGEIDSEDEDQTLRNGFAKIQTPNQLFSIATHLWSQLRHEKGVNRRAISSVPSDAGPLLGSDLTSHALSIAGYDGYADGTGPHLHHQSVVSIFPHAVHTLFHNGNHLFGRRAIEPEMGKAFGTGSAVEPISAHNQEIHPIVNPEYSFDHAVDKRIRELLGQKEQTTGGLAPKTDGAKMPSFSTSTDMLHRLGRQMQESVARIAAHSLVASRGISPEGFVNTLRLGHETATPNDVLWRPKPASSPSSVSAPKERQYHRLPLFHGTSASRHSFGSIDSKKLLYGALGPGFYLTPDLSMASDFVDHNIRGNAASAGSIRRYRIPRDFKLFDYSKHLQSLFGVPEVSEFTPKAKEHILGFLQKLAEFHGVDIDKKYAYNDADELAPHIMKFIKKITNYDIPKDTENKYSKYSYGMRKDGLIDDKYDGKTMTLRDILGSQLRNASDLYAHSESIKHLFLQDIANNTDNKLNKQFSHDASGKSLATIKLKDIDGKTISLLDAKKNFIRDRGIYFSALDLRGHLLALAGYDGIHTGVNFDPLPQDDVHPGSLSPQEKLEHWTNPKSHNRTELTIFPHAIHRLVYTGTPRKLKKSGLYKSLPESMPSTPSAARTHEMLQVPATADPNYAPTITKLLYGYERYHPEQSTIARAHRQEQEQVSRLLASTLAKRSPNITPISVRNLMRLGHSTHEQDASIGPHEREIPQETSSGTTPFYHGTIMSSSGYVRPDPAFMRTGIDGLGLYLTPKFDRARDYALSDPAGTGNGHIREYTIPASLNLAPTATNGHADRDNYISKQEHFNGLYDFFSKLAKFYGIDPDKKFDANFKTDESDYPPTGVFLSAKSDLNRAMAASVHSFQEVARQPSTLFTLRDVFDSKKYSPVASAATAPDGYVLNHLIELAKAMSTNLRHDPENIHHDAFRRDKDGKLLSDEELKKKQNLYDDHQNPTLFKDTMWGHMLASMGYDGAAHRNRVVIFPHAIDKLNLERIHSI